MSVVHNTSIRLRRSWERSAVRSTLRLAVLHVLAMVTRARPHGVSHLTFHAIPESQADLFAAFLDRLSKHGEIVSTSAALLREKAGRADPAFTISFDDGYKSTFTVGGAILHARGLPSTIFVSSGFVGLTGPRLQQFTADNLQWAEVREPMSPDDLAKCAERGIEIGSHGVSHRSFAAMSLEEARAELVESKAALERMTGRPVTYFAWPFGSSGDFPATLVPVALTAGYQALFSGVSKTVESDLEMVHPRRTIELSWGLRVCLYLALRG